MRAVLDTNVFISGFRSGGKPKIVVEMAIERVYTLVVSEDILLEIEDVLLRKFGWSRPMLAAALERVKAESEMVHPKLALTECVDPDDNRILEAAVEGRAECIVSGDRHLLRMKSFRGTKILTVNDFLESVRA